MESTAEIIADIPDRDGEIELLFKQMNKLST